MNKNSSIYVAGHTGLLGSALVRALNKSGYSNIITADRGFDLTDPERVLYLFDLHKPEYVFMAAARVGSIAENIKYPADFLEDNLLIQGNVVRLSYEFLVKKLLFFSANCCYPRECPQPMREEYCMSGPLEPTNESYAIAKIAGMDLCHSYNVQHGTQFHCVVLASLYGVNDHFGKNRAHVVADMIHKFHRAKAEGLNEIIFWGDGSPLRELMFVDDAADAAIFLMDNYKPNLGEPIFINAGTSHEVSIVNLAGLIAEVVDFKGRIGWDTSKPNGMPRKLLDSKRINSMGWRNKVKLRDGIERTYQWYLNNFRVKN